MYMYYNMTAAYTYTICTYVWQHKITAVKEHTEHNRNAFDCADALSARERTCFNTPFICKVMLIILALDTHHTPDDNDNDNDDVEHRVYVHRTTFTTLHCICAGKHNSRPLPPPPPPPLSRCGRRFCRCRQKCRGIAKRTVCGRRGTLWGDVCGGRRATRAYTICARAHKIYGMTCSAFRIIRLWRGVFLDHVTLY